MSDDIVFLSGKRTPFGTLPGSLSKVSAIDLGVVAGKAAVEQAGGIRGRFGPRGFWQCHANQRRCDLRCSSHRIEGRYPD